PMRSLAQNIVEMGRAAAPMTENEDRRLMRTPALPPRFDPEMLGQRYWRSKRGGSKRKRERQTAQTRHPMAPDQPQDRPRIRPIERMKNMGFWGIHGPSQTR